MKSAEIVWNQCIIFRFILAVPRAPPAVWTPWGIRSRRFLAAGMLQAILAVALGVRDRVFHPNAFYVELIQ